MENKYNPSCRVQLVDNVKIARSTNAKSDNTPTEGWTAWRIGGPTDTPLPLGEFSIWKKKD